VKSLSNGQAADARIILTTDFKLDLARRSANADSMKWKANLLFPEFGQAAAWPKNC
jgi:hypothetical protein